MRHRRGSESHWGKSWRKSSTPLAFRRPRFETLECRNLLSISLPAISDISVPVLAPVPVALNGSDSYGGELTYTVTSNSGVVQPILTSASNPVVKISVAGYGDMKFQLYEDLAPDAVDQFLKVVNSGAYSNKTIYRIQSNFVIQGGLYSSTDSSVVQFDDQFNPNLRFTRTGVLAMANRGSDTNTSEFFITDAPASARQLDHRYTIIGCLTEGESVRQELQADGISTNSGFLTTPITLTSISVVSNAQSAVALLSVPTLPANPQPVQVTVTVKNSLGESAAQTFNVTPTTDANAYADAPTYVTQTKVETSVDTPYSFTIATADADGSTAGSLTYTAELTTANALLSVAVNSTTGVVTVTPSGGLTGVFGLKLGVTEDDGDYSRAADTQVVPLYITPAAPTGVQLIGGIDGGSRTTLDNSAGKGLTLRVSGITPYSAVTLYADGQTVGSAVEISGLSTIDITTTGELTLIEGLHAFTAKQSIVQTNVTVGNKTASSVKLDSSASAPLSVTVVGAAPQFAAHDALYTVTAKDVFSTTVSATDDAGTAALVFAPGSAAPSGARVEMVSAGVARVIWPTAELDGNRTVSIPVQVTDAAQQTVETTLTVQVTPFDGAPVFQTVNVPATVAPGGLLQGTVKAADLDLVNAHAVTLSLLPGLAKSNGATIDSSGNLIWDVPADFPLGAVTIDVQATEVGGAGKSSTQTVTVNVVNNPPVFTVMDVPAAVAPGTLLQGIFAADDPERVNDVLYSLLPGAAKSAGAAIDSDGNLTWDVPPDFAGRSVAIVVRATEVTKAGVAGLPSDYTVNVRVLMPQSTATVISTPNVLPPPVVPVAATLRVEAPIQPAVANLIDNIPSRSLVVGDNGLFGASIGLINLSGSRPLALRGELPEPTVEPSPAKSGAQTGLRPEQADETLALWEASSAEETADPLTEAAAFSDAAFAALADEA